MLECTTALSLKRLYLADFEAKLIFIKKWNLGCLFVVFTIAVTVCLPAVLMLVLYIEEGR